MKISKCVLFVSLATLSFDLSSAEISSIDEAKAVLNQNGDSKTIKLCQDYFEETLKAAKFLCDSDQTSEIDSIKIYGEIDNDCAQNFVTDMIDAEKFPALDYLYIEQTTERTINRLINLIRHDKFFEAKCIVCIPERDGLAEKLFNIMPDLNDEDRLALPVMGPKDLKSFEDAYMDGKFKSLLLPSIIVPQQYYDDALRDKITELKGRYEDGIKGFLIELL